MNEQIDENVKKYIPNILYGQTDEEIIKKILDFDNETQTNYAYIENMKNKIDLYRTKIDMFFNDAKIEEVLISNDGNLMFAKIDLAKKLIESLQLPNQIKESVERYAERVLNEYWTRNQRTKNKHSYER